GRTARAELTGDAFTLVSPEEEGELRGIERMVGKRLPRITVPDFDYTAKPEARFEVPLAERIAAIRAKKSEDRARSKDKEAPRTAHGPGPPERSPSAPPGQRGGRGRPRLRGG